MLPHPYLIPISKLRVWYWSNWGWRSVDSIFVIFLLFNFSPYVNSQIFTRTCQDPLVVDHTNKFGHSYCFHACRDGDPNTAPAVCTAAGNCVCSYVCDAPPPAVPPFDTGICPPRASDVPDPDLTALPRCMADCAASCAGGQGMICGEVEVLGPAQNVYAKICTCYCPPQPCNPPTTTTTTTVAPVTTTQTTVVINPKPIFFLIKNKFYVWKFVIKKLIKLCFFLFKLCFLYLFKCFLLSLYYFAFYEWISWEIQWLFRQANWVLGYLFHDYFR